jgi:hypothetical protein
LKELKARKEHDDDGGNFEGGGGGGRGEAAGPGHDAQDRVRGADRGAATTTRQASRDAKVPGSEPAGGAPRGVLVPMDVYEMYMVAESERHEMRQQRDACLEEIHALRSALGGKPAAASLELRAPADMAPCAASEDDDACWSASSQNSSDCGEV